MNSVAQRADIRTAAIALTLVALWLVGWYAGTAWAMVDIWYRSGTFNHGFIVLPIALWLIWQRRAELVRLPAEPARWMLLPLAITGFGWLLGHLAGVNAVTQLALVSLLVMLVPALLGWTVTRAIAFPLLFLFFMVPIGEFAMPTLMDWTARFTVLALRLSGIPVYQEGLQFVIPSGRWSVVEACSGVRYLIASACVGLLFAYLNYVSLRRRLAFIAVSLLVPIVANWLRAYLIVMIGHLSNGKLAAGVDHLIYGWLFFGLVIAIMFMIGSRWAERDPLAPFVPAQEVPAAASGWMISRGYTLLVAILIAAPPLAARWLDQAEPQTPVEVAALGDLPGWTTEQRTPPWRPAYDNASASADASYRKDGATVGMHIAYYRQQDYQRKLVSSSNQLVVSNDKAWARVGQGGAESPLGPVRAAELRSNNDQREQRLVVWHWYWINGRVVTSDHLAKFHTAVDRLLGRGDDSAAIFIYTDKPPGGDEGKAAAVLAAFLSDNGPRLGEALVQTRQQR